MQTTKFSIEWFIKDIYGQRIISGLSYLSDNVRFYPKSDKGEVTSILTHWRYPGGQYFLSVIICGPNQECYDYVENAMIFTVGDQSPKGTNFIFNTKYGLSLPEVEWYGVQNTAVNLEI